MLVQLLGNTLDENIFGATVVPGLELGPLVRLRLLHKRQKVFWEQGLLAAVAGRVLQVRAHSPAVAGEVVAELVLEDAFCVDVGELGHSLFVH